MRFDYGSSSYLTCGDLYLGCEKELVEKYPEDVDVDIIKANQHSRDTSNSLKDPVSQWVLNALNHIEDEQRKEFYINTIVNLSQLMLDLQK